MHFVFSWFTDFTFTTMCCNPLIPHWKWPWGDSSQCSPHCFPHLEVHLKWQKAAGCQDVWQPIMSLFFFFFLFCGRGDGACLSLASVLLDFFSFLFFNSNLLPTCWSPYGKKSDSEWWVLLWPIALSAVCRDQLVFTVWRQRTRGALQLLLASKHQCFHWSCIYLKTHAE